MKIGMIGLGRMGLNMARRLLRQGVGVAAWNRTPDKARDLADEGADPYGSLADLVAALPAPRVVWLMLPAGSTVDEKIEELTKLLAPGDVIVEGGNSRYQDDLRRAEALARHGLRYVDVGVRGGIWGLEKGYCLMIGGPRPAFELLAPVFAALAPAGGYMHCGGVGAGHYVKMIHNAIEYGMMQAYAEGFALLDASPYGRDLDYDALCGLWNEGSVIRSWLLELAQRAFEQDPRLDSLAPWVDDSGEGRWAVQEAVHSGVPAPVLTLSLMERFRSRQRNSFADRTLAALRREFGGHATRSSGKDD